MIKPRLKLKLLILFITFDSGMAQFGLFQQPQQNLLAGLQNLNPLRLFNQPQQSQQAVTSPPATTQFNIANVPNPDLEQGNFPMPDPRNWPVGPDWNDPRNTWEGEFGWGGSGRAVRNQIDAVTEKTTTARTTPSTTTTRRTTTTTTTTTTRPTTTRQTTTRPPTTQRPTTRPTVRMTAPPRTTIPTRRTTQRATRPPTQRTTMRTVPTRRTRPPPRRTRPPPQRTTRPPPTTQRWTRPPVRTTARPRFNPRRTRPPMRQRSKSRPAALQANKPRKPANTRVAPIRRAPRPTVQRQLHRSSSNTWHRSSSRFRSSNVRRAPTRRVSPRRQQRRRQFFRRPNPTQNRSRGGRNARNPTRRWRQVVRIRP